ncbi:MAG TPA: Re/Si-specific NAD(P)(+) transhydrogenase subunit alpha [Candidatus Eisenbacteria bacterium]|nr:Re/Si-specific NAD(P)(+) transhydrogenase subunit alpha [Candidatus Eisenbacteria bacterium]
MRIGVPIEIAADEARVSLVPETVGRLKRAGHSVTVRSGAGERAGFPDEAYRAAGADVLADARAVWSGADVIVKVREPEADPAIGENEIELMRPGAALIGFLGATPRTGTLERLVERRVTAFAMERIPRTTRAQRMDALSSMATVAGYKAALLGASNLGKFFPLLMTAAGTIAPARVFVLGAGVAGLQAIATCRRLGAVVEAFDVRPAVKEEVQSLGATFVQLEVADATGEGGYARVLGEEQQRQERALVAKHVQGADVVITTASVPGRRAPRLIDAATVRGMRPGSVIVDMAAESGGNCELTQPGQRVREHGVVILGPVNLAATLPEHASQMYSRNVAALLQHLTKDGALNVDFTDAITSATCVAHAGEVRVGSEVHA